MLDFTRKKFLSLPPARQHKRCADLACSCYLLMASQHPFAEALSRYHQLAEWLEMAPVNGLKELCDRYHWHLSQAGVNKKEHHLLPSIRCGDREAGEAPWDIDIYLDQLRSAHNVGSIIRTTEAMALGKIYFSKNTPFVDHKQVKDTAMQTDQWVECQKDVELAKLKRPIIAMETAHEASDLFEFQFPPSFTLVVGNEEVGCSEATLKLADYIIEIPLRGRKNSLNVANAFAIAAGEICRQKRKGEDA